MQLIVYTLIITAFVFIFLISDWLTRPDPPRCVCGKEAQQLWSDGEWICDDCAEALLSGKAPKGG